MNSRFLEIYKSLLRKKLRNALERMGPTRRRHKSQQIIKNLLSTSHFAKARKIAVYMATGTEVETRGLIRKALAMGKKVFIPRTDPRQKTMVFCRIRSLTKNLRRTSYGILEPHSNPRRFEGKADDFDLVIVPGLGFDRRGGRLGRGEGYFDRFLRNVKPGKKIALAFQTQILKRIPLGMADVRVDAILTEEGEV